MTASTLTERQVPKSSARQQTSPLTRAQNNVNAAARALQLTHSIEGMSSKERRNDVSVEKLRALYTAINEYDRLKNGGK